MGDVLTRVRRFLGIEDLDRAAEERRAREEAEHIERLCRSPFLFRHEEDWRAFRRKHGRRTRRGAR